jgi:hypothetical protein
MKRADAAAKVFGLGGVQAGFEPVGIAFGRAGPLLPAQDRNADFCQATVAVRFSRFD